MEHHLSNQKSVDWPVREILTRDNLVYRGWQGDMNCVYCPNLETIDHIFFRCQQNRLLWLWFLKQFSHNLKPYVLKDLLNYQSLLDKNIAEAFQICCEAFMWIIWTNMNEVCFRDTKHQSFRFAGAIIKSLLYHWSILWSSELKERVLQLIPDIGELPLQVDLA